MFHLPGRDDPANPKILTLNQFNKAITVRFQHTKRFHLSCWANLKLFFPCGIFVGLSSTKKKEKLGNFISQEKKETKKVLGGLI